MTSLTRETIDGAIRGGRHVLHVRVYYEDTDFSGVVYHASYLRFMERGRTNLLRLVGIDHRLMFEKPEPDVPGSHFVVRAMTLDFVKAARMDDVLEVVTTPHEMKGASIILHQQVRRDGETLVDAKVRVAFVSDGRAQRIPEPLRTALESLKA